MNPETILIIGSLGATLLLVAFVLDEMDIVEDGATVLHLLNLVGAGLLAWYAVLLNSIPFLILEGIWTLVAGWYLLRRLAGIGKTR